MEVIWTATSVVVGIGVPLGFGFVLAGSAVTPGEVRFARYCFIVPAGALSLTTLGWLVTTDPPLWWRAATGFAVGAVVFVGLPESLRWVAHRQKLTPASLAIQDRQPPANPRVQELPLSIAGLSEPQYQRYSGLAVTPDGKIDESDPPVLVIPNVYLSNTSAKDAMTLRISLRVRGIDGLNMAFGGEGEGGVGRKLGRDDFATLIYRRHGGERPSLLLSPVAIKPHDTAHGALAFVVDFFGMSKDLDDKVIEKLVRGALPRNASDILHYSLEIEDVLSGKRLTIDIPTTDRPVVRAATTPTVGSTPPHQGTPPAARLKRLVSYTPPFVLTTRPDGKTDSLDGVRIELRNVSDETITAKIFYEKIEIDGKIAISQEGVMPKIIPQGDGFIFSVKRSKPFPLSRDMKTIHILVRIEYDTIPATGVRISERDVTQAFVWRDTDQALERFETTDLKEIER